MNTTTETITEEVYYPSMLRRMQGIFIDTLVVIAAMCVIASLMKYWPSAPDWVRIALFVSLFTVYEPVFIAFTPGTLGNLIMGLRVRCFNNPHKKLNIGQAYIRWLLKLSLGWISFVSIHTNPQRRAVHDLVSGSIVSFKKFVN